MMFNRRLGKSEIEDWLELVNTQTESGCLSFDLARSFLKHEDTVSFVSSVEDDIIGGTVIHRDRIRLGMILASVWVKNNHRETGTFGIIKSSLPFFKTVAIRDVEAIVPKAPSDIHPGFPGSFVLESWTKNVLTRIGFEKKANLYSYAIQPKTKNRDDSYSELYDKNIDLEKVKNLIWDSGKPLGLTNSYIWTAYNFAVTKNTLYALSINEEVKLTYSLYLQQDRALVGFMISDTDFTQSGKAAKIMAGKLRRTNVKQVTFPLVGEGQKRLVEEINKELRGSLKSTSMTLMRKHL